MIKDLNVDNKEFDFADTHFVRDIDNRVFQGIVVNCLQGVEGVSFLEGSLIGHLLGREASIKGITIEQNQKNHSVSIKLEVNVAYGLSIPMKSEEIQSRIAKEVYRLTGLHVSCVHVVFKGLIAASSAALELKNEFPSPEI